MSLPSQTINNHFNFLRYFLLISHSQSRSRAHLEQTACRQLRMFSVLGGTRNLCCSLPLLLGSITVGGEVGDPVVVGRRKAGVPPNAKNDVAWSFYRVELRWLHEKCAGCERNVDLRKDDGRNHTLWLQVDGWWCGVVLCCSKKRSCYKSYIWAWRAHVCGQFARSKVWHAYVLWWLYWSCQDSWRHNRSRV